MIRSRSFDPFASHSQHVMALIAAIHVFTHNTPTNPLNWLDARNKAGATSVPFV